MCVIERIAEVFANVAMTEDQTLNSLCGEGIFFMPELAFAYACGKAVLANAGSIFPSDNPAWGREVDLGAGGPSDLVLMLPSNKRIVVEFKMRDTVTSYLADIAKLSRIDDDNVARIFCVLLDAFTKELPDNRVASIQEMSPVPLTPLMEPFQTFPTQQNRYKGEISCVIAVWAIGHVPSWAA